MAALVEVAEVSNSRTLPSFRYLRQHDIVEISSQPSKMQSTFDRNPGQVTSPGYLGCNNNSIQPKKHKKGRIELGRDN
nr:hypothetical protein [Tanacetum cinerariifolium]